MTAIIMMGGTIKAQLMPVVMEIKNAPARTRNTWIIPAPEVPALTP